MPNAPLLLAPVSALSTEPRRLAICSMACESPHRRWEFPSSHMKLLDFKGRIKTFQEPRLLVKCRQSVCPDITNAQNRREKCIDSSVHALEI